MKEVISKPTLKKTKIDISYLGGFRVGQTSGWINTRNHKHLGSCKFSSRQTVKNLGSLVKDLSYLGALGATRRL